MHKPVQVGSLNLASEQIDRGCGRLAGGGGCGGGAAGGSNQGIEGQPARGRGRRRLASWGEESGSLTARGRVCGRFAGLGAGPWEVLIGAIGASRPGGGAVDVGRLAHIRIIGAGPPLEGTAGGWLARRRDRRKLAGQPPSGSLGGQPGGENVGGWPTTGRDGGVWPAAGRDLGRLAVGVH